MDNGSEENAGQVLQREHPGIKTLRSGRNLGFTGGNNLGIAYALEFGFEYLLLLNNDTIVEPDFLDQLLKEMKAGPKLGIVQPLIAFNANRKVIWSAGGKFRKRLGISYTLGNGRHMDSFRVPPNSSLDWATGCCMLIPTSVIRRSGAFRDVFFAYFEDVDLSLRIREMGYGIALAPNAIIYHDVTGSSKNESTKGTLSPVVFYLTARNQLFQIKLHVKGYFWKFSAGVFHLGKFFGWFVYFCLRGRFAKAKALLNGVIDGLAVDPSSSGLQPPR